MTNNLAVWFYKHFVNISVKQMNLLSIWFILLFTVLFSALLIQEEYRIFEDTLEKEIANPRKKGTINIKKVDTKGSALTGAGFTLYNSSGTKVLRAEQMVDSAGRVTFGNLRWGTYLIVETTVPSGYTKAPDKTVKINESNAGSHAAVTMTNTPIPPPPPPTPPEGNIEVLGISELPFTGMNPAIPISGISTIIGGMLMFAMSFKRKKRK